MAEYRGLDFLDYLVILVKRKKFFLSLFIISLLISYPAVYFLIPPQYDSEALLVSMENENGGLNALGLNLSNLPLSSLGLGNLAASDKYDLFTTIIYSRKNLDNIIEKFNLMEAYNVEYMVDARKRAAKMIDVEITDESAYKISVRTDSPELSAQIINYILKEVNNAVINLNIMKSKENKDFLEKRYFEVIQHLNSIEDSLKAFQKLSGLLDAENQVKTIIEAYSSLEKELVQKEIEKSVFEKILEKNNPKLNVLENEVNSLQKKIENIKKSGIENSFILPYKSLPENVLQFLRLAREVEIYNTILEFLVPIYEKAKIDEQNDIPVLQIIDYGSIAEKKSYPPRILFSLLITLTVLSFTWFIYIIIETTGRSDNPKLLYVTKNIFNFSKKRKQE